MCVLGELDETPEWAPTSLRSTGPGSTRLSHVCSYQQPELRPPTAGPAAQVSNSSTHLFFNTNTWHYNSLLVCFLSESTFWEASECESTNITAGIRKTWEDVRHQTTGIKIRVTFSRWNSLMREKCLQSDVEFSAGCSMLTWLQCTVWIAQGMQCCIKTWLDEQKKKAIYVLCHWVLYSCSY